MHACFTRRLACAGGKRARVEDEDDDEYGGSGGASQVRARACAVAPCPTNVCAWVLCLAHTRTSSCETLSFASVFCALRRRLL